MVIINHYHGQMSNRFNFVFTTNSFNFVFTTNCFNKFIANRFIIFSYLPEFLTTSHLNIRFMQFLSSLENRYGLLINCLYCIYIHHLTYVERNHEPIQLDNYKLLLFDLMFLVFYIYPRISVKSNHHMYIMSLGKKDIYL